MTNVQCSKCGEWCVIDDTDFWQGDLEGFFVILLATYSHYVVATRLFFFRSYFCLSYNFLLVRGKCLAGFSFFFGSLGCSPCASRSWDFWLGRFWEFEFCQFFWVSPL